MSEHDLELRVERLETALAELRALVIPSGVEGPGREEGAPPTQPRSLDYARDDGGYLSLLGISILVFGGAYLLRALTESHILPTIAGVILGLAYALVWIAVADRAARAGRTRNAAFHVATAAAIAFPLVWETTVRFKYVSPALGGLFAAIIGLILVFIAWRDAQESIAWIGSLGSIAVTIAIVNPDAMLPLMIAGSVVGAATLHVAIVMRWKFVALPAAILTNALAAMTVGLPLIRGSIDAPGEIICALVGFASVWLAIILYDQHLSFFDIIESALVLFIGAGGAALIAAISHLYVIPLAALYAAAGLVAYVVGRSRKAPMRAWLTCVSVYLAVLALVLAFDPWTAAVIAGVPALAAFIDTKHPFFLTISTLSLFLIAGHQQSPLFRTCLLAAIAGALAFGARYLPAAITVARVVLIAGGLKLLVEDIRTETAATLVISFAAYGLAMLTVARCARRHTSRVPASQCNPTDDTFSCSPGGETVHRRG